MSNIATRIANADDEAFMWRLYESAMRPHIESIGDGTRIGRKLISRG
jgi:hypothetical protein